MILNKRKHIREFLNMNEIQSHCNLWNYLKKLQKEVEFWVKNQSIQSYMEPEIKVTMPIISRSIKTNYNTISKNLLWKTMKIKIWINKINKNLKSKLIKQISQIILRMNSSTIRKDSVKQSLIKINKHQTSSSFKNPK